MKLTSCFLILGNLVTLFLSEPETYAGGDLAIEIAGREDSMKGEVGSLVLYPSSSVHRVTEIEQGERIACVGWLKSRIKSTDDRQLLFDLETVLADLAHIEIPQPLSTRLNKIRNNLKRRFSD